MVAIYLGRSSLLLSRVCHCPCSHKWRQNSSQGGDLFTVQSEGDLLIVQSEGNLLIVQSEGNLLKIHFWLDRYSK